MNIPHSRINTDISILSPTATTRGNRSGLTVDGRSTRRRLSHGTGTATGTRRRHHSGTTGSSSAQGVATPNEVQVAMMPDLSENMTDEERIWEEIQEIKRMPVRMAQKKELKAQLQVSDEGGANIITIWRVINYLL